MPKTLDDLGMRARRSGSSSAYGAKLWKATGTKDLSFSPLPLQRTAGTFAAALSGDLGAKAAKARVQAPPRSPAKASGGGGGGGGDDKWNRRRCMLLCDAVRAESIGDLTLDPAPEDDDDYLDRLADRINGMTVDDIKAKLSEWHTQFGSGEADFERCEELLGQSESAAKHNK